MAVPKFENFLYPFLYLLKDKDLTKREMKKALVEYFNLSDADCSLCTQGGKGHLQIDDRISWTLQYLRRALLVEIPHRGTYHISQRGLDYLDNHNDLKKSDLMQYQEFSDFATKSSTHSKSPSAIKSQIHTTEELTPTEQLEKAYQTINDELAADILQRTLEQTPQFFEKLVLDLLLKMGYGDPTDNSAMVTQYSHDGGIDGIIPQDKLGLDKIYIQAKRYKPDVLVGKPAIQAFSGALDEQKATKGVFITTSDYSKEAKSYIEKTTKKIVLINGEQLSRYMIEYNVGVSTKKIYEVKKPDSDYFEEE